jgi:hypothetical protein
MSTPKTTVKYCEESERCYAHTRPYPTVKISKDLELTLTYNRPALAYAKPCKERKKERKKEYICIWTTAKFTAF